MVQAYGMVEASSPAREPASLSALCLNTAAGQGTPAARQKASCSSTTANSGCLPKLLCNLSPVLCQ